jgi:hypothetical protein
MPLATPHTALESCVQLVDSDSLPTVLSKLNDLMSTGVGLPTLTASASFVSNLVNNSKVAGVMGSHVGPLLKTLLNGLKDQSSAVRKTYCTALGYVCRVTPIKRVGTFSLACGCCLGSAASHD